MVAFHVGMCSHDGVGTRDFATTSVSDRFLVLRQSILNCFGFMPNQADLYCFVAPEFFFGNSALPKSDYKELKRLCAGLFSAQNFILVPGSMVAYSGSKRSSKRDQYANRVPVIYGGQLLEYEKHTWGGEVGANGVGTFRNGVDQGDFRVQMGANVYRFAVEVCMEHDAGVAANAGYGNIDVHIITANTVGYKQANAIGQRFNLHCNASQQSPANRGGGAGYSSCVVYDHAGTEIPPDLNWNNECFKWDLVLP